MRKRWLLVVPILFLFDRALKIWANNDLRLRPGGAMTLIPGVVRLRFEVNTGAAFSLFSDQTWLLAGLSGLIMLVILAYLLFSSKANALTRFALATALAGGLGNLYDRIALGYVIDYVEPLFIRFAIFNLADVFICVGAALCFIGILLSDRKKGVLAREMDD